MALKKCKECGNKVSTKAKKCPNCGAKAPKRTSIFTWSILAIIFFVAYSSWQTKSNMTPEERKDRIAANNAEKEAGHAQQDKLEAATNSLQKQREKVQTFFKGKDEPTAKDALWTSHDIFKVGIIDDGTSRDGYASYVCQVLYEHGFNGQKIWVQIIDIVKLTRDNDWVKLGESHCK